MKFILLATVLFSTLAASAPADNEAHKKPTPNVSSTSGSQMNILSNVGQPGPESSIPNTAVDVIQEREKQAQQNLDALFERLNGYVGIMLFSFSKFDNEAASLESTIKNLAKSIETLEPKNMNLLVQIRFAQNVYQEMISALSLYKAFPDTVSQDHAVLRNLVQMNVCLFTLRDHNGTPDPSMRDYESWVRSSSSDLEYFMSFYGQNGRVPLTLDSVIKIQLRKLRNNLFELKSSSPRILLGS